MPEVWAMSDENSGELHVQRIGDELLLTLTTPEIDVVASLPIPAGVNELIDALRSEAGL